MCLDCSCVREARGDVISRMRIAVVMPPCLLVGWHKYGPDPDCYGKYVVRRPLAKISLSWEWKLGFT
eukprot:260962-Rhodomonas_salina.2